MPNSPRWPRFVLFIGVLFSAAVLWDAFPLLRGPSQWRWPLLTTPPLSIWVGTAVTFIIFILGWQKLGQWLRAKPTRLRAHLTLLGLLALSLLVQAALLFTAPATAGQYQPLAVQFERLASDQASGYFTVAAEIEHLPAFLRQFPEQMPHFRPDPHPRSKPPGIILLNWGMGQLMTKLPRLSAALGHWARGVRCHDLWLARLPDNWLAANLLMGLLTPLLAGLAIWPAYGLAARRGGAAAGWLAAGLVALMPGRLLFTPHMDTAYPFLTLLALYLADTGVRRQRAGWQFWAGAVVSLMTFFSLVNGVVAVVVGLFVLVAIYRNGAQINATNANEERPFPWRAFLMHGTLLVAGTLSIWLVYWLGSGVTPFAIYRAAAPARHDLARSYPLWLVGNVYDFAVFAGLPAFLLALPARRELDWRRWGKFTAVLLAFWGFFILFDLSGMIRGEVGRIWLMLAPFPALLAARTNAGPTPSRKGLALMGVAALAAFGMGMRWQVTTLEWPTAELRPIAMTAPSIPRPLTADFGADIELLGYDLAQTGGELRLTLFWHSLTRPDIPFHVFIHLTDAEGNLVAQQDVMPQDGRLPTTCWQPDEFISDAHLLDVSALPPGKYAITVGLYDQATGQRLGEAVIGGW